ncbi:MAG: ISAs1 family transposase [Candidatus Hydrogenedentota bacterium]
MHPLEAHFRYYITSVHNPNAEQMLAYVRAHWGIENSLHWVLDATFDEDQCRVRTQNAAQNFVTLRHMALNTLKRDTKHTDSIRLKRHRAAWDTDYLEYLLTLPGRQD